MQKVITLVLEKIEAEEDQIDRESIFQIAMLLEKSNTITNETYISLLPPELLSVTLNDREQQEIVKLLSTLTPNNSTNSLLFWTLGKAKPKFGIAPLLSLIHRFSNKFDDEAAYQAVIALDNFLIFNKFKESKMMPEIVQSLKENDPRPFLYKVVNSNNFRLAEISQALLKKLELCFVER